MKLSVHLVCWNGEKYIPHLFESLRKQTFKDWKLIILDNGSSDGTVERIKKELENFPVEFELKEGKENLGFAGGHNFLSSEFRVQSSGFVLLLNQDMVLELDCLEKMIKFFDKNKDAATISPRLMRWDFEKQEFTNKIDSLGFKVFKNRRVVEQYTGQEWDKVRRSTINDRRSLEVFGVSGALPMYRRSALDGVVFSDGTFFDSLYGSYKEDVDLAYRLRSAGHKAFVLLDTVAYHDRSAEGLEETGDKVAIKNKKKQTHAVKYQSYKNHLMTLYKNEYWQNTLLDFVFIKWYEWKKFFWFLLFDRKVLKGLGEIWKNRKELKNKRLEIKAKRKVDWKGMRIWLK